MRAPSRTGIVVLQLGTPDAPTSPALRRYLRQFLSDRRVVDVWPPLWWAILNLVVLPRRPAKSAALYERVWTAAGSPLAVTTAGQAEGLAHRVNAERESPAIEVAVGMRYGKPSIEQAIGSLIERGCDRLLLFPMYPQYSSATTGSSLEAAFAVLSKMRVVPPVRVVPPYYEDAGYIDALADRTRRIFETWRPDHLVVSFHGLPLRYIECGDPYKDHCERTISVLLERLGWPADRATLTFQSRFGREPWLQPYTDETLRELGRRKLDRLAVICPGFTADCLETLEEIALSGRELYHQAGGGEYRVIPCLNVDESWLDAMWKLAARELAAWI
jgi:ferrochelatase